MTAEAVGVRNPSLRDVFTDFVAGLPKDFVPPAEQTPENVVFDPVKDSKDHSRMFPAGGGVHVPGVPRSSGGFREFRLS